MKIVILNYEEGCIDVVPVRIDDEEKIENGQIEAEQYLQDHGFHTSSLSWMVCDDDVPVFWNGESIPYVGL